ncbi:hypothetical protein Ddye_030857 [Dipteronia dyeriana]|uniref:Uncharacterized protein n=1 Tax=Dipteronia dyeriana TaxID=168575 RepID=A0AAD9TH63_9ROSI|nr:hypothetical protein Ddye_030857 [Dipteronia dyeriana]
MKFRENSNFESKAKGEREKPTVLPPKLALIKEKPVASSDQTNHDKAADTQTISKKKLAHLEKSLLGSSDQLLNHLAVLLLVQILIFPVEYPPVDLLHQKDTSSLISSTFNASDARSNTIGEVENRSSLLLAVKDNVKTQGDFVQSLAAEVRAASFTNIQDALRDVAFEYQDLMKLENQVSTFVDDLNLPCESTLKKIYRMLEK